MIRLMRTHDSKTKNGHIGLEFFKVLFIGLYYYPWREFHIAFIRPYRKREDV